METIQRIDEYLLWLLNVKLSCGLLDRFMPWVTDPGNFKLPLLVLIALWLVFGSPKARWTLIMCLVALAITNLGVEALKHHIERIRPCHEFDWVRTLRGCGRTFSMPSAHAANTFSVAALLWARHRWVGYPAVGFALIIAWSRVYVGVHYPSDVVAGIVLGGAVAAALLAIAHRAVPALSRGHSKNHPGEHG